MSRPLPLHEPAERARHGGTTAPSQASVWDLSTRPENCATSTEPSSGDPVEDTADTAEDTLDHPVDHPVASPQVPAGVTTKPEAARGGSVATIVVATVAVAVIIGALYLITARTSDAAPASDRVAVTSTDAPPSISELAGRAGAADATERFSSTPQPTTPPATAPPATVPETVSPATAPPATVPEAPAPTTVAPAGPRVEIVTRTEPCKFGASCLVAGYVLHEFSSPPSEFVCVFASGNRFTFGAGQFAVERACATGSPGDSITIEVGGIRSDTVTHG